MHSVQRLYVQDIRELKSLSGRRVGELFALVAVNTLQIGDEDGEFVGKSAASN